jgi:hypothetical protein
VSGIQVPEGRGHEDEYHGGRAGDGTHREPKGRDCELRVAEVADSCPVLIGYIPLELLDFVVDIKNQRLIGNPDHGGEFMIDMY